MRRCFIIQYLTFGSYAKPIRSKIETSPYFFLWLALTHRQIGMSIERIFLKEMTFEKGRQTRNPTRSNARYSLTNPIKVETYKMAFDVYEHILLANSNDEKVSNYKLAKAVGLKVGSRTTDEAYDKAYEHRKISVAVTRKKKTAIDAISNVVERKFS